MQHASAEPVARNCIAFKFCLRSRSPACAIPRSLAAAAWVQDGRDLARSEAPWAGPCQARSEERACLKKAMAAACSTSDRGGRQQTTPASIRPTEERLVGKEHGQGVSTARGAARKSVANGLAGEPSTRDLRELERDWYLVRFNLLLAAANLEPQRHTLCICGRPAQAREPLYRS
jgi:hypothetical protein